MGFIKFQNILKNNKEKEFMCRQCGEFLDSEELVEGKCPNCETDEDIFINEL